jgi:hypothetical protein
MFKLAAISLSSVVFIVAVADRASATLIDLVLITRDPDQGIDWLDPTETVGLSVSEALAANPGWEVATGGQVCGFVAQAEPVPAF